MPGDWVARGEASDVMMESDFIAARRDERPLKFNLGALMAGLRKLRSESPRRKLVEKKFREKMLRQFEEYDPAAVKDGLYYLPSVLEWLDKLLEAELEKEIGTIPKVSK